MGFCDFVTEKIGSCDILRTSKQKNDSQGGYKYGSNQINSRKF